MTSFVANQQQNIKDVANYDQWSVDQFANYIHQTGLGDYSELFCKHKISGRLAPLLDVRDLKEMGIDCVGDRLRIKSLIKNLQWKERYDLRTKILWQGQERIYFSDMEKSLWTCCGFFPDDPSTYKLTSTHLRVKTVDPARCGPMKLCCCYDYSINNVDLSHVHDVDVVGVPAPCWIRSLCCAPGKEFIELSTTSSMSSTTEDSDGGGKIILKLKKGDGEHVSGLIMNQIEEAQVLERD